MAPRKKKVVRKMKIFRIDPTMTIVSLAPTKEGYLAPKILLSDIGGPLWALSRRDLRSRKQTSKDIGISILSHIALG